MKSLVEILTEAHIGDLKNVRYIRHYTTLQGLDSILKCGYIKAGKSIGVADWVDYNVTDEDVVYFHDARTDPELINILDCNDKKEVLWRTETLGIHEDQICCFIEYNFDLLPKKIQKKADFMKILNVMVPQFCERWNTACKIKEYFKDKVNEIDKDNVEDYLEKTEWKDISDDGILWDYPESREDFIDFIKRKNKVKEYNKSEENALLNAAIKDDEKAVISILKNHGFIKSDDHNCFFWSFFNVDGHDSFLDYVSKRFDKSRTDRASIEIYIAYDMPVNLKGCTIYFFKGMADKVNMNGGYNGNYEEFIKKLQSMPNVEIYEPGDDYSLIN